MKIVLLSAASSIHTLRWANGLASAGLETHIISQHSLLEKIDERVHLHFLPYHGIMGYFTNIPSVKKLLKKIKPDLVNAHYASGYATTARLAGYRPWLLSVWGSDVYDFPYKSPLHRWLVRKNLLKADAVASTSRCMAEQTRSIAPELSDIAITPFGVDTSFYDSLSTSLKDRNNTESIVIGTVKSLAPKYGIDTLIQAFSLLLKNLEKKSPQLAEKLTLRIVGGGPQEAELRKLVKNLDIEKRVTFVGHVDHAQVPVELEKLDIYVALSRLDSESFGVAAIEAGAAGRPVVVSDAAGFQEVVIEGETGIIIPRENPEAAVDALAELLLNPELRIQMGETGKKHVANAYDWTACVNQMINVYKELVKSACK